MVRQPPGQRPAGTRPTVAEIRMGSICSSSVVFPPEQVRRSCPNVGNDEVARLQIIAVYSPVHPNCCQSGYGESRVADVARLQIIAVH